MKRIIGGIVLGVSALSSAVASAGIAGWVVDTTEQPVHQAAQENRNKVADPTTETASAEKQATQTPPVSIDQAPHINLNSSSKSPEAVPTHALAEKHLDAVNILISQPHITALKTDDYMAIVMLNSALVQAGLEVKLKTKNLTTQSLFSNAVGCINSKKNAPLNDIAKKLISDHLKIVDLRDFVGSSPSIGATHTAKCL